MPDRSAVRREERRVERAIVLWLLAADPDRHRTPRALAHALETDTATIALAVEQMQQHGLVLPITGTVLASPCTRRLDALGLIAV